MKKFVLVTIAVVFISLSQGTLSYAVSGVGDPPLYDPVSKSYFQVVRSEGTWLKAHRFALTKMYNGIQGRLAVISSRETHNFLTDNFDLSKPTWIGLRYWCRFQKLQWGRMRAFSPREPGRFIAWHPQWFRNTQNKDSCDRGEGYMPVYYQPFGSGDARWQASGDGKGFARSLIEYPAVDNKE